MCKFTLGNPPSSYSTQDFPNYKYRPRRKKRDGQKGGQQSNTNNNSSSINNNRSNGGSPASLIEKSELLEEKLEKVRECFFLSSKVMYFFTFSSRWRVWRQPIRRQPLRCLTRPPLLSRQHTTQCPAGASPSRRLSPRRPRAPQTCSTTRPSSRPPGGSPTLPCQRLGRSRRTLCRLPKFLRSSRRHDLLTIKPMAPLPLILIASLLMAAALLVSSNIGGCQISFNDEQFIRFPQLV